MSHRRFFSWTGALGLCLGLGLAQVSLADDVKALFVKASEARKAGQFEESLRLYAQAERESTSARGKANAANGAGFVYMTEHKYQEALTHLDRAVKTDPTLAVAWNNMGVCQLTLYQVGVYDKKGLTIAQKAFRTVGQLDPEAKTGTAQVETIRTREEAWAQAAKKRAGQPPRTVAETGTYRTYKAAGEAAEQEGDFAFAQANFERAEAAASGRRSRSAAANFQGLLALRQRNPKAALEHLQRATQTYAANKYAWNNLGATLMKLFDARAGGTELIEQAIEAFKQVRRIDKTYKPENLTWATTTLAEVTGKPKP